VAIEGEGPGRAGEPSDSSPGCDVESQSGGDQALIIVAVAPDGHRSVVDPAQGTVPEVVTVGGSTSMARLPTPTDRRPASGVGSRP
jgi:hypothetical protein